MTILKLLVDLDIKTHLPGGYRLLVLCAAFRAAVFRGLA